MPQLNSTASADSCVISDFLATGRMDLLGRLFPEGLWIGVGGVARALWCGGA